MAGRIKASDIEEVKRRTNLVELVAEHVALKSAGIDSMKGLCPFHDERSPSFHVRPNLGYYHCFGCDESGDAITFVQRMDHLNFTEAVERLAARINYPLSYEEGAGGAQQEQRANRVRLLAANQSAAAFYLEQLRSDEALQAREFLMQRGFDEAACNRFGVGYAPKSWDSLRTHLTGQGYTPQELTLAGLTSESRRGSYDRFRGRIVWPIRDTSGQTVGFGARKLYQDDGSPKYLNTPETPVYRKSFVLYGLDLAKKAVARSKRVIIVEGYTDVMACHLAGEETAVATCGTAFGSEHISVLRRVMGDDASAEVIFTFDPDEAGQKAALRAFSEEKRFRAHTYVALAPEGLDPADLRLRRGDEAVQALFAGRVPMFEFVLRQTVARFDLDSVSGRVSALNAAAPIISGLRDSALQPEYTRELARIIGVDLDEVRQAVRRAAATSRRTPLPHARVAAPTSPHHRDAAVPQVTLRSLPITTEVRRERDALMAMLQRPHEVGAALITQALAVEFHTSALRAVRDAMAAAFDAQPRAAELSGWFERVVEAAAEPYRDLIRELTLAPLPISSHLPTSAQSYCRGVVASLIDRDLLMLKAELMTRMQRIGDPNNPTARQLREQLTALDLARNTLPLPD